MTSLQIKEFLNNNKYAKRDEVAELLVRKFLPLFGDGLTLQGDNRVYLEELLVQLEGKNEEEQYTLIVKQIEQLENTPKDVIIKGSELYPYWIVSYLRKVIFE